eukprot:TRINITY_DN3503_c0_g1_i2.p1 TRINITY_DN3503_c0_g1~~TRINITY_DN3503_c0_g1_i2.p1  ORF type:complete len:580 (+),score=146.32 TRINITY_DN3503_c0_g1_i2:172-1911(+)
MKENCIPPVAETPNLEPISRELMHDFKKTTFTSLKRCQNCSGLIVGLSSQGFQCSKCDFVSHRGKCLIRSKKFACPNAVSDSLRIRGNISINVVAARGLKNMDNIGKSDPYCVISPTYSNEIFRTTTIDNTTNPEWNQVFVSKARNLDGLIEINLFDSDDFKKDDHLGSVKIDISQLKEEPVIEKWFTLTKPKETTMDKINGLMTVLSPSTSSGEIRLNISFEDTSISSSMSKVKLDIPDEMIDKLVQKKKEIKKRYQTRKQTRKQKHKHVEETPAEEEPENTDAVPILEETPIEESCEPQQEESLIFKTTDEEMENIYEFYEVVGAGAYAEVWSGMKYDDESYVAIKILVKEYDMDPDDLEIFQRELLVLATLETSKYIVGALQLTETESSLYIVMDLIEGGEMFDYLTNTECGYLSEEETSKYMKDVLKGLKFLHHLDIIHRDIKLENILLTKEGRCKITDFGSSIYIENDQEITEVVGTEMYLSPEVIQEIPYGKKVDLWAAGVTTYMMLTGTDPYLDQSPTVAIITHSYKLFPFSYDGEETSETAKDFVGKLMEHEMNDRLSARNALKHEFIAGT